MKNKPKRILSLISAILFIAVSLYFGGTRVQASTNGQAIVNYATQFLGCPYSYGSEGPNSFDCSGLTYYVYKNAAGINIGRTTYDQINAGTEVSRSNLQPGDLVFTHAGHVGIYVGNNQIIHAPQAGEVVKITNINKFWRARRVLSNTGNSTASQVRQLCNTDFYASRYDDLYRAFGYNSSSLYNHYLTYGIGEGRISSQVFDVKYYLQNNPDLINAFGMNNYPAAYNHFITYGYNENRDLSPIFNMGYYIEKNPDVKNAYGDNFYGIMDHFITYGMKEGRASSQNFNLEVYKNNYEDLRNAFGNGNAAYFNHYLTYGIAEGRVAK